ncbi:MAG TPA: hypothetical protein VNT25_01105 [Allosphingosinicella sp.]|nr:hypothetical protein [Allosphingosinicella sp.]
MKIWIRAALGLAAACGASQAASAQGLVADAAAARVQGQFGAEGTLGYRIGILGFSITPSVGAFATRSDEERFLEEPDPVGGTRCRDSQGGEIVHDIRCENADLQLIGRVEATYAIPLLAEAGLGLRVSRGGTAPYATAALPVFPLAKLKANVGEDYLALGLRVGF